MSADDFTHTFHTMAEWMQKDADQRDQKPKPARVPTFQPLAAAAVPGALLRIDTVCSIVGLSRATIYRLMDAGTFPRPVHITPRCTRWRSDAVAAWSAAQGVSA